MLHICYCHYLLLSDIELFQLRVYNIQLQVYTSQQGQHCKQLHCVHHWWWLNNTIRWQLYFKAIYLTLRNLGKTKALISKFQVSSWLISNTGKSDCLDKLQSDKEISQKHLNSAQTKGHPKEGWQSVREGQVSRMGNVLLNSNQVETSQEGELPEFYWGKFALGQARRQPNLN